MSNEKLHKIARDAYADAQGDAPISAVVDAVAAAVRGENSKLREALEFYANPDTYFAIAIFADPPCGEFANDFDDAEESEGKPGAKARAALAQQEPK